MKNPGNSILLLVGLLSAICQGSTVNRILELDGHRSGIFLFQTIGSEDGILHMFEKISDKIGAYALLHYKHNFCFALSAQQTLTDAIQSKVKENGAQANIDWQSFLKTELKNIQKSAKKEDKMDLTISIVVVDCETATIAESNRRADTIVTTIHLDERFILMKTGFDLDPNEEICTNERLKDVRNWKEAAKMIVDAAHITDENKKKTKCAIIIDLDLVYPGFNGTVVVPTPIGFTPIEQQLELHWHRGAMYLLQKNDLNDESNKKIVYLFERITDKIGAYGLFHYKSDYNAAVAVRGLFDEAIRSNIAKNGGAKVEWEIYLKKTLSKMDKKVKKMVLKEEAETDLLVEVTIVDKDTATQAKWIPKTSSESKKSTSMKLKLKLTSKSTTESENSDVAVFSSKYTRYLRLLTDYVMNQDEVDRAHKMFRRIKDWKDAPKGIMNICSGLHENMEESICLIVIELGLKKI